MKFAVLVHEAQAVGVAVGRQSDAGLLVLTAGELSN